MKSYAGTTNIVTKRSAVVLYQMSRLMTKPTKKTHISLGVRPGWCVRPGWSVFAVRMKKAWVFSYPLSAQRRLWSDWADTQADMSLYWAHMPFCWFCHEAAQILLVLILTKVLHKLYCISGERTRSSDACFSFLSSSLSLFFVIKFSTLHL